MFENRRVIVTLTSIPSRLKYLLSTLLSLLKQSIKADEIVLSLPKYSVREPNKEDPYIIDPMLEDFIQKKKITVLRCEKDYGPATKLLGLLKREKSLNLNKEEESLIITVDDDKIYDIDTIKNLLEGWKRNKDSVVVRKGSIITRINKNSKLYLANKLCFDKYNRLYERVVLGTKIDKDKRVSVLFGTGGVLYRASYFNNDIFDYKKYNPDFPGKRFFTVDDIYFSGYLAKNNIVIKVINMSETKFTSILNKQNKTSLSLDPNTLNRHINPLKNINVKFTNNSVFCIEYFKDFLLFTS